VKAVEGSSRPTGPQDGHRLGGDVTLRAWTGQERSLWVHGAGGITGGRNEDWTLNSDLSRGVRLETAAQRETGEAEGEQRERHRF